MLVEDDTVEESIVTPAYRRPTRGAILTFQQIESSRDPGHRLSNPTKPHDVTSSNADTLRRRCLPRDLVVIRSSGAGYGPRVRAATSGVRLPLPYMLPLHVSERAAGDALYRRAAAGAKWPDGRSAAWKNRCSATWDTTIRTLSGAGYRGIAPDQIGFCNSNRPGRLPIHLPATRGQYPRPPGGSRYPARHLHGPFHRRNARDPLCADVSRRREAAGLSIVSTLHGGHDLALCSGEAGRLLLTHAACRVLAESG
jgi:hypothetical protein